MTSRSSASPTSSGSTHGAIASLSAASTTSLPSFSCFDCIAFVAKHGGGVRAVVDTDAALCTSVAYSTRPLSSLIILEGLAAIAKIYLYNNIFLCYVGYKSPASV